MILPRNFAGLQVTLVVNLSPTLKHWSGMLAFPEKQDRHLAGFDKTDRSSVTAFAQWGLADSALGSFTFSRIRGSAACGGASREGDSAVHWLLPVPILQVLVKMASTGGSDSEPGMGICGT